MECVQSPHRSSTIDQSLSVDDHFAVLGNLLGALKLREWKYLQGPAGVENAGMETEKMLLFRQLIEQGDF